MVIIKRDDYISFLNATGVKMPITPANDNITAQPPGNGGSNIPPNNAPLLSESFCLGQSGTISTIKRDSSQQQLQQLQQYTQQQNQTTPNSNQPLAKAQLVCRPNSHPFPVSLLFVYMRVRLKFQWVDNFRVVHFFSNLTSRWKSAERLHARKSATTMPFLIAKSYLEITLSCGMKRESSTLRYVT